MKKDIGFVAHGVLAVMIDFMILSGKLKIAEVSCEMISTTFARICDKKLSEVSALNFLVVNVNRSLMNMNW